METYYDVLGVKKTANDTEIEAAYRTLFTQFHPDANVGATTTVRKMAEERCKDISEARNILRDASKRAQYDKEIANVFPQSTDTTYETETLKAERDALLDRMARMQAEIDNSHRTYPAQPTAAKAQQAPQAQQASQAQQAPQAQQQWQCPLWVKCYGVIIAVLLAFAVIDSVMDTPATNTAAAPAPHQFWPVPCEAGDTVTPIDHKPCPAKPAPPLPAGFVPIKACETDPHSPCTTQGKDGKQVIVENGHGTDTLHNWQIPSCEDSPVSPCRVWGTGSIVDYHDVPDTPADKKNLAENLACAEHKMDILCGANRLGDCAKPYAKATVKETSLQFLLYVTECTTASESVSKQIAGTSVPMTMQEIGAYERAHHLCEIGTIKNGGKCVQVTLDALPEWIRNCTVNRVGAWCRLVAGEQHEACVKENMRRPLNSEYTECRAAAEVNRAAAPIE